MRDGTGLGATWLGDATQFRVWAPEARQVALVMDGAPGPIPMAKDTRGHFTVRRSDARPGVRYRFLVDERGPFPDPASRFQPGGVHGPSQVIDPAEYRWGDTGWTGIPLEELVLYELHVGTFTPGGTFRGVIGKLPSLVELGVTAIELMPVADFAGDHNWGYDGVALFAPARCYGTPDDLRALVDAAHQAGLAVHLDVVYSHLGPDGAYQGSITPSYFSRSHRTPWGAALNFDGPRADGVREYVIRNALHWIEEYHVDGLRLDATHAIVDLSPRHIVAEIAAAVREAAARSGRPVLVIAEDHRNQAAMVRREAEGGWELDAVWSDDLHHQLRRALAGDTDGYFADFGGTAAGIATTARQGWFYTGQHASYFGGPRGTDPSGIPCARFVCFTQNHDQVGNRPFGDRLHHRIDLAAYRAAQALLLVLPEAPLLFMGQEWAAGTPFRYFTDHHAELGRAVTEGRRREFSRFAAFRAEESRATIPDPQARATFEASRLSWDEPEREPHAGVRRLHRRLLALRRTEPALRAPVASGEMEILPCGEDVVVARRSAGPDAILAIVRLRHAGRVDLTGVSAARRPAGRRWRVALDTDDPEFAGDGTRRRVDLDAPAVEFARAGAVLFTAGATLPAERAS